MGINLFNLLVLVDLYTVTLDLDLVVLVEEGLLFIVYLDVLYVVIVCCCGIFMVVV
jgi:hypothetical protein